MDLTNVNVAQRGQPTYLLSQEEVERIETAPDDGYIHYRTDYGIHRCDAPLEYHEFGAYSELSAVVGRNLVCKFSHGEIHANLYQMWLGPSGFFRKTTAGSYSVDILLKVDPEILIANDFSLEALIEELSEKPRCHGVFYRDEFSGFLAQLVERKYQAGGKDMFNKLHDCPPIYRRKLRQREFTLDKPFLTILTSTVTDRLLQLLTEDDFYSGFLARFLLILPEEKLPYRDVRRMEDELVSRQNHLVNTLVAIRQNFKEPCEAMFSERGLRRYNQYCRALEDELGLEYYASELGATYMKLQAYVVKLAMLRQASDTSPSNGMLEISDLNLLRAIEAVERCRHWAREVVMKFKRGMSEEQKERILRIVRNKPGVTSRELQQRTKLGAELVKLLLDSLVRKKQLKAMPAGKTIRYHTLD